MPALKIHHTETSDSSWDGPANKANLKNDGDQAYYRSAFAWQDSEGDENTKTAYKFIHHFVSSDGNVGAASTVACSTGIGVLNGARGGTTIPDGDRRAVYNHLAAHLKDADMEPPELKKLDGIEYKDFEIKAYDDNTGVFVGVASIAGIEDLGGDIIEPGAYDKSISENPTIPVLLHHQDVPIGEGTLSKRGKQLLIDGQLDMDDPVAMRVRGKLKKKLLKGLSIGFQALRSSFEEIKEEGATWPRLIRHITEMKIWEVSIVTFPMLPQAQVTGVKSIFTDNDFDEAVREAKAGRRISQASRSKIEAVITELQALLDDAGGDDATSEGAAAKGSAPVLDHPLIVPLKAGIQALKEKYK